MAHDDLPSALSQYRYPRRAAAIVSAYRREAKRRMAHCVNNSPVGRFPASSVPYNASTPRRRGRIRNKQRIATASPPPCQPVPGIGRNRRIAAIRRAGYQQASLSISRSIYRRRNDECGMRRSAVQAMRPASPVSPKTFLIRIQLRRSNTSKAQGFIGRIKAVGLADTVLLNRTGQSFAKPGATGTELTKARMRPCQRNRGVVNRPP